jgi:hypothetical protein
VTSEGGWQTAERVQRERICHQPSAICHHLLT